VGREGGREGQASFIEEHTPTMLATWAVDKRRWVANNDRRAAESADQGREVPLMTDN
jgi:hypothetical protein